jgi:hypothetical protein
LRGRQSGLAAPGQSLLMRTKDAAALDPYLAFLPAVAALLHASSLEVAVPTLDMYLEGDDPEPRRSSLAQTGLVLIHLPASMVAAASTPFPQSSLLAAAVQRLISLGDLNDSRDPLCKFLRAMAVGVMDVRVPDHCAEDVHIHLEDMRIFGTIQWNMTEELGNTVAISIPLGGTVLQLDAVALCSEDFLSMVPHMEALGWILLTMTVVAAVGCPEKVPGMVQKNMTEVAHAVAPLGKALGTTQRNMKEELVVALEVVHDMVRKSMIEVVETHLVGDYANVWDPLDKTQKNLIQDRRTQDDLNPPAD